MIMISWHSIGLHSLLRNFLTSYRLFLIDRLLTCRQIRCIRPYLDITASTIATSIVYCKLDYCNSTTLSMHLIGLLN